MSTGTSQLGLYSPLPQSISDSDSEEELHSTIPKNFDPKISNGVSKDYHQLDESEEQINGFPNLNSVHMDDVPIIKEGYRQPMSPVRKFCFISSIIVCFLTIVLFLWVLPCSDDKTCPVNHSKHYSSSWDKDYDGLELMGPINVVNSSNGKVKNLIFLFRKDVIHFKNEVGGYRGGVISLMGDSGNVAWYNPRQRIPKRIECNLLDVNNNGVNDCLVTGETGLFEALDPQSGKVHWNLHIPNNNTLISSVEFPLVVLDVNNDRVNDLLTSLSFEKQKHNVITFVSGRLGSILGKPFVTDCDTIDTLRLEKKQLTYMCQKSDGGRTKKYFPYKTLYSQLLNKTYSDHYVPNLNQYIRERSNRNDFYENGRKLSVNNDGKCPKCKVIVQLFENKAQKNNLTWSFSSKNMYGMLPTKINFKNTQNNFNLQGHINGYVLKFWQWTNQKYSPNYISQTKNKRETNPNLNIFDKIPTRKQKTFVLRSTRSLPITEKSKNLTEVFLEERVMLLTYNATNFKTINASQSPIKQLCYTDITKVCQPELPYQENSVLLVDLDNDGSQELISYLTTFKSVDGGDDPSKYVLWTTVKVIQLEKELPKLYESILNVSLGMNKAIFKKK